MKSKTHHRLIGTLGTLTTLMLLTASSASAALGRFTLSATTPGGGIVHSDPLLADYGSNQLVTVTATPVAGWAFLGWQGDAAGTNPVLNLTMNRNTCVQAIFGTPVNQIVTVSGTLLLVPQAAIYPYGTPIRLVAQPQPGYYFVNWTNSIIGTQNPRIYLVTATNPSIAAVFALLPAGDYALTAIPNGLGRVTIEPQTNRYSSGAFSTLTAVPEPGQTFTGWSGNASGTQNPLTVTMDRDRSITANFTRHPSVNAVDCLGEFRTSPFMLSVAGDPGERYEVQTSTNFVSWSPLATITNTLGTAQWTDLTAPNATQRFYRAAIVP